MKNNRYIKIALLFVIAFCGSNFASAQEVEVDQKEQSKKVDALIELANAETKIATGYESQVEREITSAVEVLNADKISRRSVTNTNHVVQGYLPGLTSIQTSGLAGGNGLSFYVRGLGSTGTKTPLVLIDGFEGDFAHLTNVEIETISVLKDAAATAIYGVRGSNGVILVTTKRGSEGKIKLTVTAEVGSIMPNNIAEFVDATEYATLVNGAMVNDGLVPSYSSEQIEAYTLNNDPYNNPNINWIDEMLKSSSNYANANLQISGGSKTAKYYVAFGYMSTDGLLNHTESDPDHSKQTKFGKMNFRTNVDISIAEKTNLSVNLSGRVEDRNNPQSGVSTIYENIFITPSNRYVMYNEDGSYGGSNRYSSNPMALIEGKAYNEAHGRTFNFNTKFDHTFSGDLEGLTLFAEAGWGSYFSVSEYYKASYASSEKIEGTSGDTAEYINYGSDSPLEYGWRSQSQNYSTTYRAGAQYKKDMGENKLDVKVFGQYDINVLTTNAEPYLYRGILGKAKYSIKNRYFAELTAAYHGSNDFNPDHNMGFFPALGLGWIASDEDFMSSSNSIDYLKVRASYGKSGGDQSSARRFQYLESLGTSGTYYYAATTGYSKLYQIYFADEDTKWESDYQFNLGFDIKMFKKLNATVDLFSATRSDIIQSLDDTTSDMIGISMPYSNIGEVQNRGIELTVDYETSLGDDITLAVGGNLGYASSEIKVYPETDDVVLSLVGTSVGDKTGYVADGFYSSESEIASSPAVAFDQVKVGDIKYKDISGPNGVADGIINAYDQKVIGESSTPKLQYGFNFDLKYKGFSLFALFDGVAISSINSASDLVFAPLYGGDSNISRYAADNAWTPELGNSAKMPIMSTQESINNSKTNSLYIQDAGYLKLRSAEIAFDLPSSILEKAKLTRAKFYLRGENLFTIDNVEGINVEGSTTTYPLVRSYNVGVKVQF